MKSILRISLLATGIHALHFYSPLLTAQDDAESFRLINGQQIVAYWPSVTVFTRADPKKNEYLMQLAYVEYVKMSPREMTAYFGRAYLPPYVAAVKKSNSIVSKLNSSNQAKTKKVDRLRSQAAKEAEAYQALLAEDMARQLTLESENQIQEKRAQNAPRSRPGLLSKFSQMVGLEDSRDKTPSEELEDLREAQKALEEKNERLNEDIQLAELERSRTTAQIIVADNRNKQVEGELHALQSNLNSDIAFFARPRVVLITVNQLNKQIIRVERFGFGPTGDLEAGGRFEAELKRRAETIAANINRKPENQKPVYVMHPVLAPTLNTFELLSGASERNESIMELELGAHLMTDNHAEGVEQIRSLFGRYPDSLEKIFSEPAKDRFDLQKEELRKFELMVKSTFEALESEVVAPIRVVPYETIVNANGGILPNSPKLRQPCMPSTQSHSH